MNKNNEQIQITWKYSQKSSCTTLLGEINPNGQKSIRYTKPDKKDNVCTLYLKIKVIVRITSIYRLQK